MAFPGDPTTEELIEWNMSLQGHGYHRATAERLKQLTEAYAELQEICLNLRMRIAGLQVDLRHRDDTIRFLSPRPD